MKRIVFLLLFVTACGGSDTSDYFTQDELMDPSSCMTCHPNHYQQWSGSMHAYAGVDPVFLAMNARGQRETNHALGDFCVQCHAPMALRLGLTTDGTNLAQVPDYAKGVTCYFCHSAAQVTDDHNAPVTLATDGVMRAGIHDPVASPKHAAGYDSLIDVTATESSALCGSCHDVVTPAGAHIEQTFSEWKTTIFAGTDPKHRLSCGQCHMVAQPGTVAEDPDIAVPLREVRDHGFPAIDAALTDFPEKDAQQAGIATEIGPAYLPRICVTPIDGGQLLFRLDNVASGHMLPSGAAHDRRVWAEVHAYDVNDVEIFKSGVVDDGTDPAPTADDPDLWEIRDQVADANGDPALFFWDVRTVDPSWLLKPTVTLDKNDPRYDHSTTHTWSVVSVYPQIKRVTAEVHVRPLPFAVIDSLEASGDLASAQAASIRAALPTYTPTGSVLEWRPELSDAGGCVNPL
jgi:hypothetical protein